jgi:hypothetical protein
MWQLKLHKTNQGNYLNTHFIIFTIILINVELIKNTASKNIATHFAFFLNAIITTK